MSIILSQPVIDVENVIVVLVVIAFVVHWLARLGKHTPGVVCRLIFELRVADVVGVDKIRRQLPQRLQTGNGGMAISFGNEARAPNSAGYE